MLTSLPLRTVQDFGLVIRDRRRALGLGQQALASRVGVSRQWIVGIERGRPRAEIGLLLRTLAALGLQLRAETVQAADGPPSGAVSLDDVIAAARGKPRR